MEGDTVVKGSLCNEEVNSNYSRKEMNSRRFANSVPQKTAEISGAEHSCTGKTRAGRFTSLLLGTWFFFQCLICYAVLFALVIPLFPVIAVFFILKTVEQVMVKTTNGGIALNALDALWQQTSDVNRLAINALICVENTHSFDEGMKSFRRAILERMVDAKKENGELIYPRARCYIRPGFFQYFFQEDKSFRIENHVFKWEGEVPTSKDELAAIVSKLSNEPLPEGRSPWYFCCVPTNYCDRNLAVVFRMSHSIADGVSLTRFLINQLPDQATLQKEPQKFSSNGRLFLLAKAALITPRYFVRLVLSFADCSILHGPKISGVKKVTWQEAFELKLIKQIKIATGTTVNDVLMSCLTLALRRYFQKKGVVNPYDLTASIPVDVRSSVSAKEMAFENKFSLIFLKLAVATDGVLNLLYETKARMDAVKVSGEPLGSGAFMYLTNELCPEFFTRKTNTFIAEKTSCVLSNVPGPQYLLTVNNCPIKYMAFWPPQRDNIGLGLSIYTYAGQVIVGVQGDVALITDPEIIIEEFKNAVNDMAQCVLHRETVGNGHAL